MLKELPNFDSLVETIWRDKEVLGIKSSNDNRFPIRFILLNNFKQMRQLVTIFATRGVKLSKIEDSLPFEDGWLTWSKLIQDIDSVLLNQEFDSVIAPFSEVIRFYESNDLKIFISNIISKQSNLYQPNRRVYLPVVGLDGQRLKLFDDFNALPDVWVLSNSTNDTEKISLWLGANEIMKKNKRFVQITNTIQWLQHWRIDDTRPILCSSNPIKDYFSNTLPDSVFDIEYIENHFGFITKVLKVNVPFDYKHEDDTYWSKLSENIARICEKDKCEFKRYFISRFNCMEYSPKEFIRLWFFHKNDFDRWLLVNYTLSLDLENYTYLKSVLQNISDYYDESFAKIICLEIFNYEKIKLKELEERSQLLDQFGIYNTSLVCQMEHFVEEKIKSLLMNEENAKIVLQFCDGRFEFEKALFLNCFKNGLISLSLLSKRYPSLFDYLSDYELQDSNKNILWLSQYIKFYRKCRIHNQKLTELNEILSVVNETETTFFSWYTSLDRAKTILDNYTEKINRIFWFDGLGIEWLPLITNIINKKEDITSFYVHVGRNDLPSSTEHNKWEDCVKIDELDPKYIHANLYSYPKSLIDQIDIVKRKIDEIISSMDNETIAIVSDHGYSFLPKFETPLGYKFESSHEGRYSECNLTEKSDNNFIVWKTDKNNYFKIALRHNSLTTKPVHEVHGGCTPEEAIVPIIILSNKKTITNIVIQQITNEISHQGSKVYFKIDSDNDIISASCISNKIHKKLHKEGDKWFFNASFFNETSLSFDLVINCKKFTGYKVKINKGYNDIDLF